MTKYIQNIQLINGVKYKINSVPEGGEQGQVLTLTFQVTEDCCMACTYCYQNHKTKNTMSFEIAKQIIDNLLTDDSKYQTEDKNGVILEFIGGEPLMEIDLINQIVEYYFQSCIKLNHRFLHYTKISM